MTPEQAAQLLQQNPQLGEMLQSRLNTSGLTPAQIRERLQSSGYPSTLLDQYLGPTAPGDSGSPIPSAQALAGVRALGLSAFTRQDSVLLYGDTLAYQLIRDSLRIDSVVRAELANRIVPRLSVFGVSAFRRASSVFNALSSGPVDQNYRLGPGDAVALLLTGETELAVQLDVTREGSIFIPDVGQIFVNSLTLAQLRDVLYTRLPRVYSGISRRPDARTKFDITVTRIRPVSVRVIGEVGRPGAYQVSATGGVLNAIYEAGGISPGGSFRSVTVRRGADSLGTVDLYRYLLTGAAPTEMRLDGGDVVFVPVHGPQVKITGEVVRPAIYELRPGEGLRDLIRLAGGLSPRAATSNVTISRILPADQRTATGRERTLVTADLKTVMDDAGPNPLLFADDSVTIFPVRGAPTGAVMVAGSVWQPGTYRLETGMRLWDVIRTAGGLRPETYAGRVQIVRSRPDSTRVMMGLVLDSVAPNNNPLLQEQDNITLYPRTEFRPDRYVSVHGAVRKPGMVVFADSMTLRDAVLLAGGTTEDAYLAEAEISRVRMDGSNDGDSTAVALRVPLDSAYVTDATGYVRRPVGSPAAPAVTLEPYDNVYIRRQPGLEAQRTVALGGEVRFPGRYTLLSRDERISDLIQRAGGLTSRAYPNGVRFYRQRYEHDGNDGLVTPVESRELEHQGREGTQVMRLGVNLARVLRDARYRDNITLAHGDSIYIPAFIPVVLVEGAVSAPSAVTYVRGAGRDYYINAAGGYTRVADKRRTFVEQPNGHIEKNADPQAGAVIVVPARDPSAPNPVNLISVLGVVAQLISAATAIVVVLAR